MLYAVTKRFQVTAPHADCVGISENKMQKKPTHTQKQQNFYRTVVFQTMDLTVISIIGIL